MKDNYKGLVYIASCALHKKDLDEEVLGRYDLREVFSCLYWQGLAPMTYSSIEKTNTFKSDILPAHIKETWREARTKSLKHCVLMDNERKRIYSGLDKLGIWHFSMKGIVLQDLYPEYGVRMSADNDVLYDKSKWKELCDYMTGLGYTAKLTDENGVHDKYLKEPAVLFEFHRVFYAKDLFNGYYNDISNLLKKGTDGSFEYHFSNEDFYHSVVTHAYKHFVSRGIGIRFLMDMYLYYAKYGGDMDIDYLEGEMKKTGVFDFERVARSLAFKMFESAAPFDDSVMTEEENELFKVFEESGLHGTQERTIAKKLKDMSSDGEINEEVKRKYLLKRVFPDFDYMKRYFPIAKKLPFLIPFLYPVRIIKGFFGNREFIKEEYDRVKKSK